MAEGTTMSMFDDRYCQRCGVPCRPGGDGNPSARLLRHANQGVCPGCGLTLWLQSTPVLAVLLGQQGPDALRMPHIQQQVARIMAAGQADAAPAEIDWGRVIDNWELP